MEKLIAKYVLRNLPHGSGIDAEWKYVIQQRCYRFENSFHVMNENGYYEGWQDFALIVPKSDWEQATVVFPAPRNERRVRQIQGNLEEILSNCIWSIKKDLKVFLEG